MECACVSVWVHGLRVLRASVDLPTGVEKLVAPADWRPCLAVWSPVAGLHLSSQWELLSARKQPCGASAMDTTHPSSSNVM